jgi:selenide, water dikinase
VKYLGMGLIPGGTYRNEKFRNSFVHAGAGIGDDQLKILFDPQTSGGLLIAVRGDEAENLLERLLSAGVEGASIIGEVVRDNPGSITIFP